MSDQEFYGKDILKIPVKKYGYHYDLLSAEEETASEKLIDDDFVDLNLENNNPSTSNYFQIIRTSSNAAINDRESMPADLFLKTVDENLLKVKTAQQQLERQSRKSNEEEEKQQNFEESSITIATPIKSTWLHRNVSHFVIVVLVIFLLIVIPAFFILYKILTAVEGGGKTDDKV